MNKTKAILEHLQTHKTLTSWDAIQLYRATRLSGVINRLRTGRYGKMYDIETKMHYEADDPYGEYIYHGECAITR